MAGRLFEIAFQLAGRISSSFNNMFSSAADRMRQLNQRTTSLRSELRDLERAHRAGTIGTREYADAYARLTRQLQDAERAQQRYSRAVDLQQRVGDFRNQAQANMMDAAGMALALGAPVYAAMKFESSMADVKKVVDFDAPEQYKAMEKDILNLSKRIPMAAEGLAQIVASGGQAGIAREELLGYAEAAAKMGVAFDISADEAGQTMAQWRSAFKMNQEQVNTLADQINHLGNTTAASAPKISDVVRRIGPLGEVGGTAAAQVAALGATMVGAGVQTDVAATGIKNLILSMVAGESATKSQSKAFQKLGFDAVEMSKYMQEDAEGAIMQVMKALQGLPKHEQASVLATLVGKESIGAISPLLTNLEALEVNFGKVGDAAQYAGSMQKEFDARSATTENSLQLLKNQVSALAITTGSLLLPHIVTLANKLSAAAERVAVFTEKHPGLTKVMVIGTAAALGLGIAVTALAFAASLAISPFVNFYAWAVRIQLGTKLAAAGTRAWAMAQRLLNLAMRANLIGLIVTGIAAVIAGGIMLYKNFESIRNIVDSLWGRFKETFPGAAQFIETVGQKVGWLWDKLKGFWKWLGGGKGSAEAWDVSTESGGGANIPQRATNEIQTRPHLALEAEVGPKAASSSSPGKMTRSVVSTNDLFSDKVSEPTRQAVIGLLNLKRQTSLALNELNWSGQAVTSDMAIKITTNFSDMKTQIVSGLQQQNNESLTVMRQFFADSDALTEQNELDILKKIQDGYQARIATTQKNEATIKQILETAASEKRALSEQERQEIDRIKREMTEAGVRALSKGELESKVIIERMKQQHGAITAQEAAEVVGNSLKIRDETVQAANDTYNQRIAAVIHQRDELGTISAVEAQKLIESATFARDELVKKAEETHQGVVAAAKSQAGEYVNEVDWMTGEVLSKWTLMLNGIEARVEKFQKWLSGGKADVEVSGEVSVRERETSNAVAAEYATGGILTRPHLGLVAEDGPEAIIPLSPGRRGRALGLWQKTGEFLGVRPYAAGGIVGALSVTGAASGGVATQKYVLGDDYQLTDALVASNIKENIEKNSLYRRYQGYLTRYEGDKKLAWDAVKRAEARAVRQLTGFKLLVSRAALPLSIVAEGLEVYQAENKKRAIMGGTAGITSGMAGAKLGAVAGTAIAPGLGTVLGGVIGGAAGYIGGKALANKLYDKIFKYATGGILTRPHLGIVAEAGPEAIIPLSQGRKERAVGLWEKAGELLGVKRDEIAASKTTSDSQSSTASVFTESRIEEAKKVMREHVLSRVGTIRDMANISNVTAYATGGILTRPHLGLVAEDGPEAIIPLSPGRRGAALELWQKTGQYLGVVPHAAGGVFGNTNELHSKDGERLGGVVGRVQNAAITISEFLLAKGDSIATSTNSLLNMDNKGFGKGDSEGGITIKINFAPEIHGAGPDILPELESQQNKLIDQVSELVRREILSMRHNERRVAYAK